jgi:hypothetical protein
VTMPSAFGISGTGVSFDIVSANLLDGSTVMWALL